MTLYTSKAVAEWLGLTERRVRQLRDEGVIQEKSPGLYDMRKTVTRYILFIRKGNKKADLNDERAMLTRAKREAADMENKVRRGELHSAEDIEKGIKTMCLNIRSRFLTLPAKLAPTLVKMGSQAQIFDELKKAIDEALEELRSFNVALALNGGNDEEESESVSRVHLGGEDQRRLDLLPISKVCNRPLADRERESEEWKERKERLR